MTTDHRIRPEIYLENPREDQDVSLMVQEVAASLGEGPEVEDLQLVATFAIEVGSASASETSEMRRICEMIHRLKERTTGTGLVEIVTLTPENRTRHRRRERGQGRHL